MARIRTRRAALRQRPARDDRGSSAVEFTILFPVIVLLLFAGPQLAMWYFAREAAQHAAVAAARAAAVQNATAGSGKAAGEDYLTQLGSGTITGYTVTEDDSPTTVTIHIHASVPNIIPLPGFDPAVDVTLKRNKERFTTENSP